MKETQISSDQTTSCVFFDPECEIISSERVKEGQVLFFDFFFLFFMWSVTELFPHRNKVVKRSQFDLV